MGFAFQCPRDAMLLRNQSIHQCSVQPALHYAKPVPNERAVTINQRRRCVGISNDGQQYQVAEDIVKSSYF
jgi:hypothetical protein